MVSLPYRSQSLIYQLDLAFGLGSYSEQIPDTCAKVCSTQYCISDKAQP